MTPPRITGDTDFGMTDVSIRDLRNHGGEVIDRVLGGQDVVITRSGRPVAQSPRSFQFVTAAPRGAFWLGGVQFPG